MIDEFAVGSEIIYGIKKNRDANLLAKRTIAKLFYRTRNLFERTLENQALRLASIGHLTSEMLCEISIEDVKSLEN